MSHVDKGELHAYLDGALDEYPAAEAERIREHVDQCAQCAISLEAERRIRMDAQAILGLAAPDVDMPSLEELRAYVKRTREPQPAATRRIYRMGWAASVLLAVGAGWTLRGGQLQDAGLMSADFQRPAAEVLAPARDGESADFAATVEAGAGASGREAESRPDEAESTTLARADAPARAEEVADEVLEVDDRTMPAAPAAPQKIRLASAGELADPAALGNPAAGAAGAALDVLTENVAVLPPAAAADSADPVPADQPAPELAAAASDLVAAAEPERAERRRAESLVPLTSAMTRSALSGQRQTDADEAPVSAEPSLMVEGYDFVSMVNMGEGTTPVGVHVVQRYTADSTFEIFHLAAGVGMDVLPATAPGHAMVSTETERGLIVVRGPLSETELRELLAGLFTEPGVEETGVS